MSVLLPSLPAPRGSSRDGQWPVRDETITLRDIVLEGGDHVDTIDVHYRLEGAINSARDNVVLVIHALTGTVHASEWWKGVIGTGGALDPTKHAILCANLLGGCDGTTGPTNSAPDALPPITTRDQAAVLAESEYAASGGETEDPSNVTTDDGTPTAADPTQQNIERGRPIRPAEQDEASRHLDPLSGSDVQQAMDEELARFMREDGGG